MALIFQYEKSHSPIFGNIYRPVAQVFLSTVDIGADYTLLPKYFSKRLGVDLKKDLRLGEWERNIPLGFLDRDNIPPLLGRQLFLETFDTWFSMRHSIVFSNRSFSLFSRIFFFW